MDLSKKTIPELVALCKERQVKGYSGKSKAALLELLAVPVNQVIIPPSPESSEQAPHNSSGQGLGEAAPSFIEVCSGCGGLSAGLIEAGFKPLLLNEINKTFCETLKANHPGVPVEHCDMLKLGLTKYKGQVDLLTGGVPCQAYSQAGERRGLEDPRGQLIVEFNRLVTECEPKVLMVENVKGLLTHNGGATLTGVLELFSNGGKYKVFHQVLNAKDYEVPQKRERVFIVGIRTDLGLGDFVYPAKSKKNVVLRDVLRDVPASVGAKYPEAKRAVMAQVPAGGCWVDLPEAVKVAYMGASMEAGGGKRGIARRLSLDEHCLTLTTSPAQKQTERCHPTETRPLTVREYARIQTFPDTYSFSGGMANQYKQIGNAVPVKLASAMGVQIKNYLG
jgi:DNA (cytosine-5)-methyltransferase 1